MKNQRIVEYLRKVVFFALGCCNHFKTTNISSHFGIFLSVIVIHDPFYVMKCSIASLQLVPP
jgi:hypothetical protein